MGPDHPAAREERLDEMPSLARLYSKALGRSASLVLASRRPAGGAVPDVAYVVEGVRADPAGLAAYEELLGEPGTDVLPPGYVHVLAFPLAMALMVRPDFPLPVLGLVHVENRVVQRRALHLEDVLTVRAWAEPLRPHRRGTQVDLVVDVSVGTERVWQGTSTYLAKHPSRDQAGAPPAPDTTSAAPLSRDHAEVPRAQAGPTAVWRLGSDTGKRYASVSGDRNPIHVSRLGARAFGFPRPIAHGMYTAARALATIGRARGEAFTWEVSFAKPVLLPSRVALDVTETGGGHAFTATRHGRDTVHLTGSVRPL
ncbi:MaoC/PaaZ C-terminal domain-containing protein [Georgenia wangjunii]|uniref:MaoC/PaaZ C-terminal domain-containing protein n=1 Tax=Georgenia wangjunii TaxID=3117730 RepID=UPI002F2639AB